ncbi:hypothetical protein X733_13865 [Mesorhizobium sp. L2C067A000]|nr:hypothetical protein X733_13865 [Mesorhizobium sp. L2C067A000]
MFVPIILVSGEIPLTVCHQITERIVARSTYIYILYDPDSLYPHACFTVKHEAVTFWKRNLSSDPRVTMERTRDGQPIYKSDIVEGWQCTS